MSTSRLRQTIAALCAAFMALFAVGGAIDAGSAPSEGEEAPQSGGTLTMLVRYEVRSLDPLAMNTSGTADNAGQRGFPIFDALVIQNPETAEVEPQLAESLTSPDGLVWTLELRPDVVFSDGTPFDAEAVMFNWERHRDPANQSIQLVHASQIESMNVVDPLTLEVTLTEPNGQWPQVVASTSLTFIGSPTAIEELGPEFANSPVGAGPFLFDEWVRDDHMTLVRNPTYWNQPRPYVDELVLRLISDESQRRNSIIAGEAQLALLGFWASVDAVEDAGLDVARFVSSFGTTFNLNNSRPPFDDVRVRRAIAMGISLQAYSDTIEQGTSPVPTTWFHESSPFYEPSIQFPEYDADAAQLLIDEVVAETGEPVTFTVTYVPARVSEAEFIQAELAKLDDIEVMLEPLDLAAFIPKVTIERNYDMSLSAFVVVDPEPILHQFLHSESPTNPLAYANPEMDAALDAGRLSQVQSERVDAYRTVQEILSGDQPLIVASPRVHATAATDEVRDLALYGDGTPLVDRIWLADS